MRYQLSFLAIFLYFHSIAQIHTLGGKSISKEKMDQFVQHELDSLHLMGLSIAVVNDGKVVYHHAVGLANVYTQEKMTDRTMFEFASMGKSVFAFFVMRLVDEHILSLDTPLYKYMPYPDIAYDNRYQLITARMVLDHTTGFPNWRDGDSLKILFTPGTKWSYSGEGYEYLAKVIEHLTNHTRRNLDSLFTQEVAIPLNMEHTHYSINPYIARHLAVGHVGDTVTYEPSDKFSFSPAGGLYSDPLDFTNFLIGVMDGKILSKASYDEMLRQQVRLDSTARQSHVGDTGWGLGFAIGPTAYGNEYSHGGNNWGYTGFFMLNREKRFGFVVLTNSDQMNAIKGDFSEFLEKGE
jgi:CubicO group peptidase (beta-lactamase class C family)